MFNEKWKQRLDNAIDKTIYQLRLLPHRARLLWNKSWIRKDEFHKSLDLDASAMIKMNKTDQRKYLADLMRRRNIAHERDFDV